MRGHPSAGVAGAVLALAASAAGAAPTQCERAIQAGRSLDTPETRERACAAYGEAISVCGAQGGYALLYNAAIACDLAGCCALALDHASQALRSCQEMECPSAHQGEIQRDFQRLLASCRCALSATASEVGASLTIDGEQVGGLPGTFMVGPGKRVLIARTDDATSPEVMAECQPPASLRVALVFRSEPSRPASDPPPTVSPDPTVVAGADEPESSPDLATWGWISAGVGVAGVAAGVGLLVVAQGHADEANAAARAAQSATAQERATLRGDYSAATSDRDAATGAGVAAMVVGGAALATGAALIAYEWMGGSGETASVAIAPGYVGLAGSF